MSSPAPRRFAPQLEETTTSSHRRRFAPEPVEISTRHSRAKPTSDAPDVSRDTARRKLPEPIETSTNSYRGKVQVEDTEADRAPPRKRFLPEPVETIKSHRVQRDKQEDQEGPALATPIRRFKPEPIESSTKSNRKAVPDSTDKSDQPRPRFLPQPVEESVKTSRRKKFSPQLIETASGSHRSGDPEPSLKLSDKTEHDPLNESHPHPIRPSIYPLDEHTSPFDGSEDVEESRFSSASLSRKQTRSHSFRVPSLPSIASNEEDSDESAVPSLSNSDSAESNDTVYKHASRIRESCDERFSGYLLQLASRAAEKQLKDQAMAAYPNERDHEPVDHFAVDKDDEEDERKVDFVSRDEDEEFAALRRESAADLGWELAEMRTHQKKLSKQKQTQKEKDEAEWMSKPGAQASFQPHAQTANQTSQANDASEGPKNIIGGWQKGVGLNQMRSAASPPMLGDDLIFPKSMSPKATRLDVDQRPVPGKHGSDGNSTPVPEGQLWLMNDKSKQNNATGGLWMGCCKTDLHRKDNDLLTPPRNMKSGIITPLPERNDSVPADTDGSINIFDMRQLPPSPPSSQTDARLDGIDRMLHIENEIENEFNNAFVTQIYNYLSLGYPSLAWKFDHELSKISKVPVAELRRDDHMTNAKGHVGAPEGDGVADDMVIAGRCARWTALRLYVREWARQQPGMADHHTVGLDSWGVRARRGSWAI